MNQPLTRTELVDALCVVGKEMYARGWMLATGGNLSGRCDGVTWMSASGGHKGRLTADDFVAVDSQGVLVSPGARRPSAESVVHAAVYNTQPHAGAVVHVHGPYMTLASRHFAGAGGVALQGWEFVKALGFWEENARVVLPVSANPADLDALASAVVAAATDVPAVLVAGHGVYAWGRTVADAQRHAEATEFLCQMAWETR